MTCTMWRPLRGRIRAACPLVFAMVTSGCGDPGEKVCQNVGRDGALVRSADRVLSIAIAPEALDETHEICIAPSDAPPMVAGPAYRVTPAVSLHFATTITYRGALPDDTSMTNVGRIDAFDFEQGKGTWRSLGDCRVEPSQQLVRCVDDELAAFYGLLDEFIGNTADSVADTISTTPDTGDESDPTTMTTAMTTAMETSESGDTEDPIDYPPECDSLFAGPFTVEEHGVLFTAMAPDNGPEDIAMDGNGGFVGRSGNSLARVDMATMEAMPLPDAPTFATSSLGLRYLANGDLVILQRTASSMQILRTDGTLDTVLTDLALPNAVFVDTSGIVWFSEYTGGRVSRLDLAVGTPVEVGQVGGANGVIFDPLRSMLFYVGYDAGQLFRVPIMMDGTAGPSAMVADLTGFSDGLAMDVCGNLYVVDQGGATGLDTAGNTSRLDRVTMNDLGELGTIEQIAAVPDAQIANAVFGTGEFSSTVFMVGLPGAVFSIELQIDGAPTPVSP